MVVSVWLTDSGYNQIKMAKENKNKTTFISEWGTYAYNVIPFGLCNALVTLHKVVTKTFKPCLNKCMQVFLNDLVYMDIRKITYNNYKNV